tara:strand:- start:3591 stop:3725 length:135 start_codon:yes stop_codon:yes gene_type:complete
VTGPTVLCLEYLDYSGDSERAPGVLTTAVLRPEAASLVHGVDWH